MVRQVVDGTRVVGPEAIAHGLLAPQDVLLVSNHSTISDSEQRSESRQAATNGAQLGGSLLFTAAVGLLVSLFVVPQVVSESEVGILGFGEAVASIGLVVAGFGMDSYLRKEIATRKDHASEFFSALLIVRLFVSLLMTGLAVGALHLRAADLGSQPNTTSNIRIVVLFCVAQFFIQTSESFAAMLQAVGRVKVQSQFVVISKTCWAVMVIGGLWLGFGIWVVPAALIITELAKTVVFGVGAQRAVQLSWRPTFSNLPVVIVAAFPFLITTLSVKLIQFLDVAMIKFITGSDRETGFYNQALRMSGVALLLAPIIQWVVLPMASRAVARSRDDFASLVKRSYEAVLCAGIPLSILLSLNADVILGLIPDGKFLPSVPALRILSLLIVLSYVSMLGGTLLIADGRGWRVVRLTFLTIGIDFVLNLYMIRHGWQWWGPGTGAVKDGGAGTGAAISLVTAEVVGSTLFIYELRRVVRRVSDAASIRRVGLTIGSCMVMIAVDRMIVGIGLARPFVDFLVVVAMLRLAKVIDPSWWGRGVTFASARMKRMR